MLWLNNNRLAKLTGLQQNWRLRELYLQNNQITTVCNASCCLPELLHLNVLDLSDNLLQDLSGTLQVLSKLRYLKHLNMSGNPLTEEQDYRPRVLAALSVNKALEVLDSHTITEEEWIGVAPKPKIKKKMGFGGVVKPWDKIPIQGLDSQSVGEVDLKSTCGRTLRRREREAREADAAAFREAAMPEFDVVSQKDRTSTAAITCQVTKHSIVPAQHSTA